MVRERTPKVNSQLQQTTPGGTRGEGLLSRGIIDFVVRFAFCVFVWRCQHMVDANIIEVGAGRREFPSMQADEYR